MTTAPSGYPQRWDAPPLDPRTVEWFARLNEDERRNLIELSHLSDKDLNRLTTMLAMDGEVGETGVKLATRSAFWKRVAKRFPFVVGAIAAPPTVPPGPAWYFIRINYGRNFLNYFGWPIVVESPRVALTVWRRKDKVPIGAVPAAFYDG